MRPPPSATPSALMLGVAALLVLIAVLGVDLYDSRRTEYDYATRQIALHDRMLAEYVARSLDSVEVLLDEMHLSLHESNHWQRLGAEAGHRYLKSRLSRTLPQIRHLHIFDAKGIHRHTSATDSAEHFSVEDRAYFRALQDGAERARFGPYVGRSSGQPGYIIARRLAGPGNTFGGILLAAVAPEHFEQFCHSTRPYDEFEAAVINTKGQIVSFCRALEAGVERWPAATGFDFRQALAKGEFAGTSVPEKRALADGPAHVLASEPVPGYPELVVVSTTPRSKLTQGWRHHAWRIALLAVLALAMLGAAGLRIRRHLQQAAALAAELKRSQDSLEERIRDATRELEARRNEAERLSAAKARFFAAASHDLRQPLHALQLFLGDLARLADSPEQQVLLQRIEVATRSMTSQLRSLLDLSRLDMANIVPERVPVDLERVFEQLEMTYMAAADAAGVRLHFRARPRTLETDPALLTRLLGNLIDNAIKFSPKGRVLVCARWRTNAVRIEVRDCGKGIPPDQQQVIYDEFYQIGNAARDPGAGLGLGLAIAHRIARLLGINISLRSAVGAGTTFALTLPCTTGRRSIPSPAPQMPRLVVIGDPSDFAERARRWGYTVEITDSTNAAWRLLDDQPGIPVVICNDSCHLGNDLLSLLKQHPGVVISPAACDMPDIGAYHLREPVKPARLRALLRSLH